MPWSNVTLPFTSCLISGRGSDQIKTCVLETFVLRFRLEKSVLSRVEILILTYTFDFTLSLF